MNLPIETKIVRIATGQRGLVVGSKSVPYEPKNDIYNRKEIFPENDYLIFLVKEIKDNEVEFSGLIDVFENEIQKTQW